MGARVLKSFDLSQVTHLLFSGGKNAYTNKDFRSAVQNNKVAVSHLWVEKVPPSPTLTAKVL